MVDRFDRVVIEVSNLDSAIQEYRQLFGVTPTPAPDDNTTAWLALPNTVIELRAGMGEKSRVRELVFAAPDGPPVERSQDNALGLSLKVGDGQGTATHRKQSGGQCTELSVDHVVLRTGNADACIDTFRDQLGIRLALDKTVPEWGGRMLFFRAGKLTLEVIESAEQASGNNYFWGIAYQCPDIEETAAQMRGRGVVLSRIREGRKPGTRVATVKSHCLGIPTLLIEPSQTA